MAASVGGGGSAMLDQRAATVTARAEVAATGAWLCRWASCGGRRGARGGARSGAVAGAAAG